MNSIHPASSAYVDASVILTFSVLFAVVAGPLHLTTRLNDHCLENEDRLSELILVVLYCMSQLYAHSHGQFLQVMN